jgi:hypothetical protein
MIRAQNEKLQRITEQKHKYELDEKINLKLCSQVERYKEVIYSAFHICANLYFSNMFLVCLIIKKL